MITKAEREMRKLADHNAPGLMAVPARVTGEQRGGVKEATTKVKGAAEKLNSQVKEAAEERQKKLAQTRQIHTPKTGSKSDSALSPATQVKVLLGQPVENSGLQQKTVKGLTVEAPATQVGTPPRVQKDTNGPQLEPRNLGSEMMDFELEGATSFSSGLGGSEEKDAEKGGDNKTDTTLAALKGLLAPLTEKLQTLILKVEQAVTKEDLAELKTDLKKEVVKEVREEVKKEVKKAVEPVTKEVQELKGKVVALETGKGTGKGGKGTADPAPRRVEFKGFKKETDSTTRLAAVKAYCARYPGPAAVAFGNNYKGPYNNRELKATSFAEFVDADAVREFLKNAEGSTEVQGAVVTVKKAAPRFYKTRDWALYTAKEKLEKEAEGKTVEVHREGSRRTVTVDASEAFVQEKEDTKGSFAGDFSHLSLP